MNRSFPKHLKNRGFALVITVSLLVLLALVAVGLLTLSTVTLRSSSQGSAQLEARSNARLALMIALGELQKTMGPDQRVSAAAGILDENSGTLEIDGVEHPWWTAVWSTKWAGPNGSSENVTPWVRNDESGGLSDRRFTEGFDRTKEVLAYLVSGNEGGRKRTGNQAFLDAVTTKLTPKEEIVLVGPGTLGAAAAGSGDSKNVVAKRIPTRNSTREVGAYAYWVGDLGIKANVGQVDRHQQGNPQRGADAAGMERLLNAQDIAEEFVANPNLGTIAVDETDRIVSEQSVALAKGVAKNNAQAHFHDITQSSRSVLTNVRQGGLQRDLTAFLNSPTGKVPDLVMDGARVAWGIDPTDKIIGPANPKVAAEQGTRWNETKYRDIAPSFALLRHWNKIGQELAFTKPNREMLAPASTKDGADLRSMMNNNVNVYDHANENPAGFLPHDESNLSPVMTEGSIYYNLASYPDTAGSRGSEHNLRICLYPRIALWNPYNVELELSSTVAELFVNGNKDVEVRYGNGTAPRRVPIPFGRGSKGMGVKYAGTDKSPAHYVGTILFTLPAVTIAPGETLVFSPNKSAEYKIDTISQNTLSPGVAPDPSKYYWADMNTKHAQAPTEFIESPGGGNSSGGDNYLMALKAVTGSSRGVTDLGFDSLPQIVYANTSLQAGGGDELPVLWNKNAPVEVYALANSNAVLPGMAIPDVRTRDGFRFRWWKEELPSNVAGSGQLQRAPKHFQSAVIANWNPRAAYFSRTPWDNVTDLPPHFYGCYTRDLFDEEVSWAAMAPKLRNGRMTGSPFSQPIDGPEQLVLFEVPRKETGIPSIGYLRHLKLSEFGWHPSYAIGNSLADPRVGRKTTSPVLGRTERDKNGWNEQLFGWFNSAQGYWAQLTREILFDRAEDHFVVYDLSYEANFNLWDNYFMSTGTANQKSEFLADPLKHPLPNGRIGLRATSDNLESDLNDFHRTATQLMLEGGFNVHSTSKEAWKAILATTADTEFGSTGAIPFPRLVNPPKGEWLDANPRDKEATAGFRSLSEYELDALAEQIVREVKERAPFFGLADFVNRRLVDSKHGDKGPIEAAIDAAGINKTFDQEYPLENDYDLPDVTFFNMKDTTRMDQTLKPSSTAWGIPGYLTQGDVLQVVGSTLTSRSDTFMIRAYGESVDAEGKVLARAWCEATVQRTPEPIIPDAAGVNPAKLADGVTDYGRRFRLVSFRWMAPEEV
jgi:hypothetical protein